MGFLWPVFLLLLGLIPLLVALYILMLRRRRRYAVRYSSLSLVRLAQPHQSSLRRHLPFALFILALASLVVAFSRPVKTIIVPTGKTTIILAIDVSRSMCSTDIQPNRLEVAKNAALSYIKSQPTSTQIGIVAFAGFAELVQPPTTNQEALRNAVVRLTTGRWTAIGSAILESVNAIAEVNRNVAPSVDDNESSEKPTPVPSGKYIPDIIVLLTDGASNAGPMPKDAAQQAVDRGIRVYTIGFGTQNGSSMNCGDFFLGGGNQSGRDSFRGGFLRGIDEPTLKEIAGMTGGEYYSASSAGELQKVFQGLPTNLMTKQETMEISAGFTALGGLLAAAAVVLSMIWHPLP